MNHPIRRAFLAAAAVFIGYSTYQAIDINRRYPIVPPPSYLTLPALRLTQRLPHPDSEYITCRIPLNSLSPNARADPLPTFLSVFWSSWTLKLEALAARLTHYPAPSDSFASGLFITIHRSSTSVVTRWTMPRPFLAAFDAAGVAMVAGGMQELAAVVVEDQGVDELELAYGCVQHYGDGQARGRLGGVGVWLHRFYMKFLLDKARRKLVTSMS